MDESRQQIYTELTDGHPGLKGTIIRAIEEIVKLRAELAAEREKHRWIPVSTPPEEDGTLPPEYCFSSFNGNHWFIKSCYFWCRVDYEGHILYHVFAYFFDEEKWIPMNMKSVPSDFAKYITHWMPLPEPPEKDAKE